MVKTRHLDKAYVLNALQEEKSSLADVIFETVADIHYGTSVIDISWSPQTSLHTIPRSIKYVSLIFIFYFFSLFIFLLSRFLKSSISLLSQSYWVKDCLHLWPDIFMMNFHSCSPDWSSDYHHWISLEMSWWSHCRKYWAAFLSVVFNPI